MLFLGSWIAGHQKPEAITMASSLKAELVTVNGILAAYRPVLGGSVARYVTLEGRMPAEFVAGTDVTMRANIAMGATPGTAHTIAVMWSRFISGAGWTGYYGPAATGTTTETLAPYAVFQHDIIITGHGSLPSEGFQIQFQWLISDGDGYFLAAQMWVP